MRNRDAPAGAYAGQHAGDGSDIGADGLTKREAAAIAAMQGIITASDYFILDGEKAASIRQQVRVAVRVADALFDELERAE